jgi:hypothetical protein
MDQQLQDEITELNYKPSYGLQSIEKFYHKLRSEHPELKKKDVLSLIQKQDIDEIMKEHKRPKQYSSIRAYYNSDVYEMDIIIYDRYSYYNYKYILVVIDVYSRFLQCRPIKTRNMSEIISKLEDIFTVMPPPHKMKSDNEFNTKEFNQLMSDNGVICHYSDPYEINKNPIVERVNRTIARSLQKVRLTTKSNKWTVYTFDIVDNYNNTIHNTTHETPIDIWENRATPQNEMKIVPDNFKVGDKVRTIIHKRVFGKSDEVKYSPEIYDIVALHKGKCRLDDGNDYKAYELKKTNNILMKDDYEPEIAIPKTKRKKQVDVDPRNIINSRPMRLLKENCLR